MGAEGGTLDPMMIFLGVLAAGFALLAALGWLRAFKMTSRYSGLRVRHRVLGQTLNNRVRELTDSIEQRHQRIVDGLQSSWNAERERLTQEIISLASRPPVVIKDNSADLIKTISESVTHLMNGGVDPNQPKEEPKSQQMDGVEPAVWYPDVELDEWLAGRGGEIPKSAGWLPPPTHRTEYMNAPDTSADAGPLGLEPTPRSDGDSEMFKSGEGGITPSGGVE